MISKYLNVDQSQPFQLQTFSKWKTHIECNTTKHLENYATTPINHKYNNTTTKRDKTIKIHKKLKFSMRFVTDTIISDYTRIYHHMCLDIKVKLTSIINNVKKNSPLDMTCNSTKEITFLVNSLYVFIITIFYSF